MSSKNLDTSRKSLAHTSSPRNSAFSGFLILIWRYKYILALIGFLILLYGAISYKQAGEPINTYFCSFTASYPEYSTHTDGRQINNNANLHGAYVPRWIGTSSMDRNELLTWVLSTELVDRVGAKIQYDVNYFHQGRVSKKDVYDTTPLYLEFLETSDKDKCVAKISTDSLTHTLEFLSGVHNKVELTKEDMRPIKLNVDKVVETPMGKVVLRESGEPYEKEIDPATKLPGKKIKAAKILLEKSTLLDARLRYDSYLNVEHDASGRVRVLLETDRTSKFGLKFLQTFIDEVNKNALALYREEQENLKKLAVSALAAIEKKDSTSAASLLAGMGIAGDLQKSEFDLKLKLSALLNQIEVDQLLSQGNIAINVIDPPKEVPGKSSKSQILLISIIMAAVIPLFLLYLFIALRRFMLSSKDLSPSLRDQLLGIIAMRKSKSLKANKSVDALRFAIENQLEDKANACVLLAGLSVSENTEFVAAALVKSFERKGIKTEFLSYNSKKNQHRFSSVSMSEYDPNEVPINELLALIERNRADGKLQIIDCTAIAKRADALELTRVADMALIIHQLGRSSINHRDDAQHFVLYSRCPSFATWLKLI